MSSDSARFFDHSSNTKASHGIFFAAGHDVINNLYGVDRDEKILATLMPVARDGHINRCMEGTRQSELGQINAWMDDFTAPNILLLTGSPGAGKSTLAASIVSNLCDRQRLGSSFAFKHDNANLSDPASVWRTVASDLARFHPGVRCSLVEILRGVDPGL